MASYRLTNRSEADLLDIFLYGIECFDPAQAERYADQMAHCFRLLADKPNMGRPAPLIGDAVRRHEHGSHVILYEPDEHGILILAVVHKRSIRSLKI